MLGGSFSAPLHDFRDVESLNYLASYSDDHVPAGVAAMSRDINRRSQVG